MVIRRVQWAIVALAFTLPLVFAAITHHAWEDYFITLRTSRNLVEGNGLVFTPGERLHTFTSPLGVLVPALCTAIAGVHREAAALWLFRVINATALAAAATLAWRRAATLRLGGLGRFVLFGLLLADPKLTDFSINGMETALLVFFVLLTWSELEAPGGPRTGRLGMALAGLMWTRPDAFVLGGALIVAHACFRPKAATPRAPLPGLIRSIGLGALLYAPWLVFAWWYYGSPVPHTIVAKAAFTARPSLTQLLLLPWQSLRGQSMLPDLFLPSYWVFGGWPAVFIHVAQIIAVVAAFAWLVPRWSPPGRRASFALFIGMFYFCSIILFPWYLPPWTVLAIIALAFVADQLHAAVKRWSWAAAAWRVTCVSVVLGQAGILAAVTWQIRIHQRFVETGVRRAIGEWLHANAGPHDSVFLEPLGYIGYFSQLKTYDFPGLSSSEVVSLIHHGARQYAELIDQLHPTWLVLRPEELARFQSTPILTRDYTLVRSWDARPELNAVEFLPGRGWVEWEACYLLFRRKPEPAGAHASTAATPRAMKS